MSADVLKSLARLMQQTAVKQAVQERALLRLLALVPADQAATLVEALKSDVAEVMDNFSAGIDQPAVNATITAELTNMLAVLSRSQAH